MFIVYMHTLAGKSYIGQTCQPLHQRTKRDFSGYKDQAYWWNAIQKYGYENIKTEVLYSNLSHAEADRYESLCIDRYNTIRPYGYNLQGGGSYGRKSAATRAKMSESQKGKPRPQTRGELNGMYGTSRTGETNPNYGKGKHVSKMPQILELIDAGLFASDIADRLDIPRENLSDLLRRRGIKLPKKSQKGDKSPRYRSDVRDKWQEICEMYHRTGSVNQVRLAFGVHASLINEILDKYYRFDATQLLLFEDEQCMF